jgi:putative intracellular protease/amidase
MKLYFTIILCLFIKPGFSQKILFVSTNVDKINNESNGTFLMEIAEPFEVFTKAGFEVDIVTPNGGKAALYHRGKLSDTLRAIQESEKFNLKSSTTLSPKEVKVKDYAGIFYPGGGGQFYDVFDNAEISSIATKIYESGGVLGTTGHGPASLINIKLTTGEYFVNKKKITCFPKAYSAKWLPFDWEEILKARGAEVIIPETAVELDKGVELLDKPNRLISGSYAENSQWVARQMILMIRAKSGSHKGTKK